jgi:tRNA dimethylallyltransferase
MVGIKKEKEELKKLIEKRLEKRLKQGMIKEVERLHSAGVSWEKLENFGLEYKWVAKYLQGKITKEEVINSIQKESEQYARRQMTWFKRDKRIKWIKNQKEAEKLVKDFL